MTRHSFDTNVFLDMWRLKYPLYPHDVFPSLRDRIAALIQEGAIFVCQEAFDEVAGKEKQTDYAANQLKMWRDEVPEFVRKTANDKEVALLSAHISGQFPKLIEKRKKTSLEVADPFIIAHASVRQAVAVTNEKAIGENSAEASKIPDVCKLLTPKVKCMDLIEFMRHEGMEF